MKTAPAALLSLLALTVSACNVSINIDAPEPSVGVHVANHISDVVVTGDVFRTAVGNGEDIAPAVVAPCGGTADVRAFIGNTNGGSLTLFNGADDRLNADYGTNPELLADSLSNYDLSIIWSDGQLADGDWITVTPTEVIVTKTQPEAIPPTETCEPWAYEVEE